LRDHTGRLSELESSVLLLKSLSNTGSSEDGKPGFLDSLETLVENLRKECYMKFADRDLFSDLGKRVSVIEE